MNFDPPTPVQPLHCELVYHPPLDWQALLSFLRDRSVSGVEAVRDGRYLRTVQLGDRKSWVSVHPSTERAALIVQASPDLSSVLAPLLERLERLFDLTVNPHVIAAHLGSLASARPGVRVPGAFDGFEIAVRAILGQQISVPAATTLAGRLAAAFGEPVETPDPALHHLFPDAQKLAGAPVEALASSGIIHSRAQAIITLAGKVAGQRLRLEPGVDVAQTIHSLKALPGIGEWTAQYIAMRALSWPDAFPHTDLGIRKALAWLPPRQVLALAEAWRPWRAYAAMQLWVGLKEGN